MSQEGERSRRAVSDVAELLPSVPTDETDEAWGEPSTDRDEELRREVPPHHD